MNVPNSSNLINQAFNHDFVEFVWVFGNEQIVFQVWRDKKVYLEGGEINETTDYVTENEEAEYYIDFTVDGLARDDKMRHAYYLIPQSELVRLAEQTVLYLKLQ